MNREIYPGGIYPLQGDLLSQAGNTNVRVVGLEGIPIQVKGMFGGEVMEYNVNSNQWVPTLRATIQVNGVTVSDDPEVFVNLVKPITVNGT
jgi:hypothetical protein